MRLTEDGSNEFRMVEFDSFEAFLIGSMLKAGA